MGRHEHTGSHGNMGSHGNTGTRAGMNTWEVMGKAAHDVSVCAAGKLPEVVHFESKPLAFHQKRKTRSQAWDASVQTRVDSQTLLISVNDCRH